MQPRGDAEVAPSPDSSANEPAAVFAEVRRFRASLADALDYAVQELLRDIAAGVLARELLLEPCDVRSIVERACRSFADVVAVRAHPDEIAKLTALDVAVVPDATLRRGDVKLDLHAGSIDLSLGARLDAIL